MTTELDVVNECLGTMGEAPLNTLSEPHEFRGTAQRLLKRNSNQIQSLGWWFNTERFVAERPTNLGYIQLPGDVLKWASGNKARDTYVQQQGKSWIVMRGRRLYDTVNGTYEINDRVVGEIVRELPFADLPPQAQEFVAAQTVLRFQSDYDADNSKRQELQERWKLARLDCRAENIRQNRFNFRDNNPQLAYVKSVTRAARRYIR